MQSNDKVQSFIFMMPVIFLFMVEFCVCTDEKKEKGNFIHIDSETLILKTYQKGLIQRSISKAGLTDIHNFCWSNGN